MGVSTTESDANKLINPIEIKMHLYANISVYFIFFACKIFAILRYDRTFSPDLKVMKITKKMY